ncbi:Glycosyl transferase, group 2 [Propionibacterium freudenreichii]|nr:Glycosyl transferase, group 2 [Propionibacterium freudenreichii]SCQ48637.1 Glycosyl transferase, group 2 [Propionibacterium freudenreichii]
MGPSCNNEPMAPRVSVVIPAFNNADYLEETLRSALTQDYDDYEVVVADHSSTDDTADVIHHFAGDPRLRVLDPTPAGGGAKRNWDRVSQAAHGELIKLLPGDDLIKPDMLSAQVAVFDRYPSVTLCTTRRDLLNDAGKVIMRGRGVPRKLQGLHIGASAVRATVRAGSNLFGEPGCVMLRKAALEAIDWWDGTNSYVIDERSYCRALLADAAIGRGDFYGIPRSLGSFRVSGTQWSVRLATSQAEQVTAFHTDMAKTHPEIISQADLIEGNLRARAMAHARRLVYFALGFGHKG